jgi:hypothetical protein
VDKARVSTVSNSKRGGPKVALDAWPAGASWVVVLARDWGGAGLGAFTELDFGLGFWLV